MKIIKKYMFIFTIGILLALTLGRIFQTSETGSDGAYSNPNTTNKAKITVASVGDILMHSSIINSCKLVNNQGYDFKSIFSLVKPYIGTSDVTIGNMESPVAGPQFPYKGYPVFNTPDSIVNALKYAGIEIVSTANNHLMDTGLTGLQRTHNYLNAKGIHTCGTSDKPNQDKGYLKNINNINVAFLAYTETTNKLEKNAEQYLGIIDKVKIKEDIAKMKQNGADVVVVSLHFGQEYQKEPNQHQRDIARETLSSGADVILGCHPHVLQPMEKVKVDGKDKLIIYSLGNFISNQFFHPNTHEGMIVFFDFVKNGKVVSLENVRFLPTIAHKYSMNSKIKYKIIPLLGQNKNPDELALPGLKDSHVNQAWNDIKHIVNKNTKTRVFDKRDLKK